MATAIALKSRATGKYVAAMTANRQGVGEVTASWCHISIEAVVTHSWTAQLVLSSVLANDCFLVLSGFFAGHTFLVRLKAVNRKSAFSSISNLRYGCIDIPRMYAQRLVACKKV